jgi:hypothetical protein
MALGLQENTNKDDTKDDKTENPLTEIERMRLMVRYR